MGPKCDELNVKSGVLLLPPATVSEKDKDRDVEKSGKPMLELVIQKPFN